MFRTVPEDRLHPLIRQACQLHRDEESVYRHIQREFGGIKPVLADLTHALPSLIRQKQEMTRQTLQVLGLQSGSLVLVTGALALAVMYAAWTRRAQRLELLRGPEPGPDDTGNALTTGTA